MFQILTRSDVFLRALKMASIVGIILAAINHGDHLLLGTMTFTNWVKFLILFNFLKLYILFSFDGKCR